MYLVRAKVGHLIVSLATLAVFTIFCPKSVESGIVYDNYARPSSGALEHLTRLGYIAEAHNVSFDDHMLDLTRANNPLFANKTVLRGPCKFPVLFIHGLTSSARSWLAASNVKPKDFSNVDVGSMTEEQLHLKFGAEPSARSIATLLLNFGCEIWLLSRRPSLPSINLAFNKQKRLPKQENVKRKNFDDAQEGTLADAIKPVLNLPGALVSFGNVFNYVENSFDTKYWNFSMDEQVRDDMTQTMEYILRKSQKRKLTLFGHSSGGAMVLMKLASAPETAERVRDAVLYSPASHLTSFGNKAACFASKFWPRYRARPFFPTFLSEPIQGALQVLCNNKFTQSTICPLITGAILGFSANQQVETGFTNTLLGEPSGFGEMLQMCQILRTGKLTYFDWDSKERNIRAYGQPTPPIYDLSKIRLPNMIFFGGSTDLLVTIKDVEATVAQLTVPFKLVRISKPGLLFNHAGYFEHKKIVPLVYVPTIMHLFRPEAELRDVAAATVG